MVCSASRDLLSCMPKNKVFRSGYRGRTAKAARRDCASALKWFRSKGRLPLSIWWCAHVLDLDLTRLRRHGIEWQDYVGGFDHPRAGLFEYAVLRRTGSAPVFEVKDVMSRRCPECGKTYDTRVRNPRTYCSNICAKASHASNWVPIACAQCGTEFLKTLVDDKRKYCSRSCSAKARLIAREARRRWKINPGRFQAPPPTQFAHSEPLNGISGEIEKTALEENAGLCYGKLVRTGERRLSIAACGKISAVMRVTTGNPFRVIPEQSRANRGKPNSGNSGEQNGCK
jgi:hypothetical protein